jgi:hypothetical protein
MNNQKKINEPEYFTHKDICDCDETDDKGGCKIFPKGKYDGIEIPEGLHCKIGKNPITYKCPKDKKIDCDKLGGLGNRRFMTIPNTSEISDEEARKKCMAPMIYHKRDINNDIQCMLLSENEMKIFKKNEENYMTYPKKYYYEINSKFNNVKDMSFQGCISNMNIEKEPNFMKCVKDTNEYCDKSVPDKYKSLCIINKLRGNCIPLVSNVDSFNQCLTKYKEYSVEQQRCPPGTQNYTLFDCIPEGYKYNSDNEILSSVITGKSETYIANVCPSSITENNIKYEYLDETMDNCVYYSNYKIDLKENIKAWYCNEGPVDYTNKCEKLSHPGKDYASTKYNMLGCQVVNPLAVLNNENSRVTCQQECPVGYYSDNMAGLANPSYQILKGNNCIQLKTKKKEIEETDTKSLENQWNTYCSTDDNLEMKEECIKTINLTNDQKKIIGTTLCNGRPTNLTAIYLNYEEIANELNNFDKEYKIDRKVYITKKYTDNDLNVKIKPEITFNDYITNSVFAKIYFDKFLVNAIINKEFEITFKEISCYKQITGYIATIKRLKFAGSGAQCCDINGINYYLNVSTNTINSNFKNEIITSHDNKYTCNINYAKLKNPCVQFTSNIIALKQCLNENPDVCAEFKGNINDPRLIKCVKDTTNICLSELKDYCISGGINLWGDGIPRIIDIYSDGDMKGQLKYPRCGIDYKKKYPQDYENTLQLVCDKYDNRGNKGYTYYKTNPICQTYCNTIGKKPIIDKCINNKFENLISSKIYKNTINADCNNICKNNDYETIINGEIDTKSEIYTTIINNTDINANISDIKISNIGNIKCTSKYYSSNRKRSLDKLLSENITNKCTYDFSKDNTYDGCLKGKKNYCLNYDYDENGNKINRFFISECQDLLSKDKNFGLVIQGICVMNRKHNLYNNEKCKNFRNEYEICLNDNILNKNNMVFSDNCKQFNSKYKIISDLKKTELCKENPFIEQCYDESHEDFADLNMSNQPYKLSIIKRLAAEKHRRENLNEDMKKLNNKLYIDKITGKDFDNSININTDEYLQNITTEYILDHCLSKKNRYNEKCEKIIDDSINSYFVDFCTEDDNFQKIPLCKKLYNARKDQYIKKTKQKCMDKDLANREFTKCINMKMNCEKYVNDDIKYKNCIKEYENECNNYINCNYSSQEKQKKCYYFKKYEKFYNDQVCHDKKQNDTFKIISIIILISTILIFMFLIVIRILKFFIFRKK